MARSHFHLAKSAPSAGFGVSCVEKSELQGAFPC